MNERKGNLNGGAVAKAGISFGSALAMVCLLYTSDAADEFISV